MASASLPPFSSDAPASGANLSIDGKALRFGCFGCSSALFLAGCLALFVIAWGFLIPNWRINHRYRQTTCEVLDAKLESQMFNAAGPRGGAPRMEPSYRPSIKVRYQAESRQVEVWTYDGSSLYHPDRPAQQAVVDSFKVGATYPIWYDPDRPDRSVLVRGDGATAWAFLILPVGLFIVSGFGLLLVLFVPSRPSTIPAATAPATTPTSPLDRAKRNIVVSPTTQTRFDPSALNDPVALKTEWNLVYDHRAIANVRLRKLALVDPERLQYRITLSGVLMPLIISIVGLLVLLAFFSTRSARPIHLNAVVPILLGFGMMGLGGWLLQNFRTPITFDKRMGYFWKGRKSPDFMDPINTLADVSPLHDIHALQLLRGRTPGGVRAPGYSELNLVLRNGSRLNVINESSAYHHLLRNEAVTLAEFLHKPLWDAS